jgi:hypothetical protein
MSDPRPDRDPDAPLNTALKSRIESVYDTKSTTPTPFDTASAREGEGEGWPIVWLVVAVVGVVLAFYFIL